MCDLRLDILAVVETPEYEDVGAEFVVEVVGADPVSDSVGSDGSVVDLSGGEILSVLAEDGEVVGVSSDVSCLCDEYCVDRGVVDSAVVEVVEVGGDTTDVVVEESVDIMHGVADGECGDVSLLSVDL